jgi:hypothetical protein
MTPRRAVAELLCTAGAFAPAAARADVAGPDDSVQQAFGPLAPAAWYPGAFTSAGDPAGGPSRERAACR